ncbi:MULTISPECIES: apolipoprotein N-acyltransferase [unclassified Pseudomonas]|uniref:apolipoprotein N-acyltransferase n=1 Tax=Pseudomonas TaxID=286 RepID=UPI0002A332D9|nr:MULTISPECIES: apolipoprotein N-acyltransferase [unclassified Pseudomonas]MBB1605799.1 apolipoprotein N-acyltransferase [Pseudomonas sp. UMC76]MBB1639154.1 apolipoprotein N-acyltransferase [Pseudomonas sp. UME83]NTX89103.1 apolipoprotein N-acyltransferase [Pseudomonas sp. UMA643]NTY17791.1 apolipoprotein N-acyltransferase [Pseudomonas sp. UMC3103]NTY24979.1 apolipoprotein N-acyltransferase [Pseudomonas sp. UMA603]
MRWITRPGWPGHLLALAAGAITPLALAPYGIWPLALLSVALFYLGLRGVTPGSALWRGWWYGFGAFLAGTGWIYYSIHDFGGASPALAGFLVVGFSAGVAFFFGLPAWAWVRLLRRNNAPVSDSLAFAALWLGLEVFRSWFLTGFPWLFTGYSQLQGPLAGLAPIGGVWLISFSIALCAALLINLPQLTFRPAQLVVGLVLLLAPWIAGLVLKGHAWTAPAGAPLTVAAIQGNVAQDMKWDPKHVTAQLELYRDLSAEQHDVDLIVLPETAVPLLKDQAGGYLAMLDEMAKQKRAALITGVPMRQRDADGVHYYNGITVVGDGSGDYLKQKLVPFGEYVPLQDLLRGLITFFDLPMSDFARGPADQALLKAKGYAVAPYICYEVVYPEFAAGLAAQSQLLLTISNDAWFGTSIGPLQHLQMAQMRALEAGRWMVRGTNNGVTALIDPQGRIAHEIPQFQQGVLRGEVTPMQGLTPYLKWRLWPLGSLAVVLALWAVARRQTAPEQRRMFG